MAAPEQALMDWAGSGAMALTGRPEGPPLAAPGRAASLVQESLRQIGVPPLPGLLAERAAYAGLRRNGPWSCGGAFRALPTADGHVGLSLSRHEDLSLLPALVEGEVDEPWSAVARWARGLSNADVVSRLHLLGLAGGSVPAHPPDDRPGVRTIALGSRPVTVRPLVVDLTSLWAGPLCAHLLGLRGAHVVKVESRQRPDGAGFGNRAFFDLLHAGHDRRSIDFRTELDELRTLVAEADLVLEASRPRALRQLGILAEEVVAAGTSWLSITARGRGSETAGFGDDVAVAAGLFVRDADDVLPAGDALADPLTGAVAAVHALDALASEEARLVDVSMLHVAAEAATGGVAEHEVVRVDGAWWVETAVGRVRVAEPAERR